jgi:DNA-binding XRE family transcriptional regulator
MQYTEELANEVKAKYAPSAWTLDRWKIAGEIPDRIFKDSKLKVNCIGMSLELKAARRYLRLEQKDVIAALKLQGVDVTRQSFYNWETGKTKPCKTIRKKLINFYKTRIDKLNAITKW